jgi:hypothetical protein
VNTERPDWIIRINDKARQDDRDVITRRVTEALEALGYEVLSVRPPLELNPAPLRTYR